MSAADLQSDDGAEWVAPKQATDEPNRVRIVGDGTMARTRIEDMTTGEMMRFVTGYTLTQRKGECANVVIDVCLPAVDIECDATTRLAGATRFAPGDRVQKVGGSYQATGEVKAAWLADDGTARYVFRFDNPAGMLHIFGDANLEPATAGGAA